MTDVDILVMFLLSIGIIVLAIIAVLQKNLIRSVFAYAISSISLAGLFFMLASPYAGALELTVGAGLVTVLFLVALILAGGVEEEVPA